MTTITATNPYLLGNFAPVSNEIQAENLKVIGKIPTELEGMFVRNGPNPQFSPIGQYHWFDGDGMLHGVRFENGEATYHNRYIRTFGFEREKEAGKAIWSGLLEPPQMDNPYGPGKNTANTALVWHSGKFLAVWEGGEPHQIQLPSLETLGPVNFDGKLTSAFTAHPKVDPVTGEMLFFGYSLMQQPFLQYGIVSSEGELVKLIPIELPVGVMMHDFAITEHYTIFLDFPFTFRPERMAQGQPIFLFEEETPSRFGILPRHGEPSDIRWFESPSCYGFHTLNAYESGDEVILIACRMESTNALGITKENSNSAGNMPYLYEWRFNLQTGAVQEGALGEIACEFPRINERYVGRKNRYGYAGKLKLGEMSLFDGLLKYDLETGKTEIHSFEPNCYGGEAVFVPHPKANSEDHGWLLTFVYNEDSDSSEVIILDAQNFTQNAIARIILPQRVPYGFHGAWVDAEQFA